ncbi:MAG: AAA family ATPase [Lachnospiraceae bacterium]|nr:AAA family ATPase [Lachnospiraceae bacterium]
MIKSIELTRFKKYKDESFKLNSEGVSLLVGGNNAGKSTLIYALAVWEFCKMILLHEKGRSSFNHDEVGSGEGFGMSAEEFLPIAVPTLNHLWTNLKTQLSPAEKQKWRDNYPGYIMRIKCTWDYGEQRDRCLEIGLSLVNDRLFIRVTESNLIAGDHILNIVYLPTFAGVLPKENKATRAERRAYLGRGMAGSIIRNMIYDLYIEDIKIRKEILNGKTRMTENQKVQYSKRSPLQKLQDNLRNTFYSELDIEPFSEDFHTIIKVNERKVVRNSIGELETLPKSKYTPRDIITQGSGYLQWLSIFCILYSSNVDVLLLDEPDAHLHASLQSELLDRLLDAVTEDNKMQILVSTHSVEMIKQASLNIVFSMESKKYLKEETSRVAVLKGIGSEYFPKLDLLKQYKRLIFVENESDRKILSILGVKCGITMPDNVVYWANTDSHADRRRMFEELRKIIPGLKCVSLRDRDMDNPDVIGDGLEYKAISLAADSPIILLEWRRKNIESYLLCPRAIAEASGHSVDEVKQYIQQKFALAIDDDGYVEAFPPETIITLDGKHIYTKESVGLEHVYHCNKYDVAQRVNSNEVCADIKTFITRVRDLFVNE